MPGLTSWPQFGKGNWVKQVGPANTGASDRAQARLDTVATAAAAQLENAAKVDGTQIHLWRRSQRGAFCTCQNDKSKDVRTKAFSQPGEPTLAPGGASEAEDVGDMLRPTFSIRSQMGDMPAPNVNFDGADGIPTDWTDPASRHAGHFDGDGLGIDVPEGGGVSLDDLYAMVSQVYDNEGQGSGFSTGGVKTRCTICMGTGYVEGFSFIQGQRIVLDASQARPFAVFQFRVNRDRYPFVFESEFQPGNYVMWTGVELPTYFDEAYDVICRNNASPARNVVVEVSLHGANTWVTFNQAWLAARAGLPTRIDVRVCPASTSLDGVCEFTHCEWTVRFAPPFIGQLPSWTPTDTLDRFVTRVETNVTLTARIPDVISGDILYETKHDALYRVTTVTEAKTNRLQVIGWSSVNLRLLQLYEQPAFLRLVYNRNSNLSYGELERVMGRVLYNTRPNFDPNA